MTRLVAAYRRQLQKELDAKTDWRTVLKPSGSSGEALSSADTIEPMAQAIEDCKYAIKLNGESVDGSTSYAALWNHFAMWLYNNDEILVDTHLDHAYYLAIKEIRQKLQTSQCLLR